MSTAYSHQTAAAIAEQSGSDGAKTRRLAVNALDPHHDEHLYTNRHHLQAEGHSDLLAVDFADGPPALFAERDGQLVHLDRLARLTNDDIDALARAAMEATGAASAVFEDVEFVEGDATQALARWTLTYKGHWSRSLNPGESVVSGRRAADLRRKAKKLAASFPAGTAVRTEFRRTRADDIDLIAAMNRQAIERAGRTYHLSERGRTALIETAENIGWTVALMAGDKLIAGDIVLICGRRAYFPLVGFDLARERYSPGLQIHVAALEELSRRGVEQVFLLWGDSRWKADIGAVRSTLATVIVRRGAVTLLSRSFWRTAAPFLSVAAKQAIKRLIRPGS